MTTPSETTTPQIPSVVERTSPVAAGTQVVATFFLADTAVFVLGEEALLLAPRGGEPRRIGVHDGGILCAACRGMHIVTGGDDGRVVTTGADATPTTLSTDPRRRWIDHVAIAPGGTIAWSAGKEAFVQVRKGEPARLEALSTVGRLAFAPKGLQLAIAHYNGVTLWFPGAAAATPEFLEWKGSHTNVTFSPDGRFLVTAMQEPTLHGWRLADGNHMRMSGYSAKVRSMAWSADGEWLVTSGAPQLVAWPFRGKEGPMGKQPTTLAAAPGKVCAVACHPRNDVVAAGYEDGLMLLVRLRDGAEVLARRAAGSPVSSLAWNAAGTRLAFGTEDGDAGVIELA